MELVQLESMVAVARELHFRRAADRVYLGTSTVSRHVRLLERELGIPLFERTTRRVRLTPQGRLVFEHARAVLENVSAIREIGASDVDQGDETLRIAYHTTAGELMSELVLRFRQAHPSCKTVCIPMSPTEINDSVRSLRPTVGITTKLIIDPESNPEEPPDLLWMPMRAQRYGCVAAPQGSALGSARSLTVQDLHGEDYVFSDPQLYTDMYESLVSFFERLGLHPSYRLYPLRSESDALALVASGAGFTLMGEQALEHEPPEGVAYVELKGIAPVFVHGLVWPAEPRSAWTLQFAHLVEDWLMDHMETDDYSWFVVHQTGES